MRRLRRSALFEDIIRELGKQGKLDKWFDKTSLIRILKIHQKYMVFVYKHSDPNNEGSMTLYFKRKAGATRMQFMVDGTVLKRYLATNK
jgi:hypothetical protein